MPINVWTKINPPNTETANAKLKLKILHTW